MAETPISTDVIEKRNFKIKSRNWPNVKCFDFEFYNNVSDEGIKMIEEHIECHENFKPFRDGGYLHYSFRKLQFCMKSRVARSDVIDYLLNYIDDIISMENYDIKVIAILKGSETNYLFLLERTLIYGIRFFEPFGIDTYVAFISGYTGKPQEFPHDSLVKIEGDHLRGGGEYEGIFKAGNIEYELYIPNTISGIDRIPPGKGMKSSTGYLTAEGVEKARYATLTYNKKVIKMQKILPENWQPFLDNYNLHK